MHLLICLCLLSFFSIRLLNMLNIVIVNFLTDNSNIWFFSGSGSLDFFVC